MQSPGITWQEKVRGVLDQRRISARRLAKRIGRSDRTVRAWLDGTNAPLHEAEVVAQIAAALNVPVNWLLSGEPGGPPEAPEPAPDFDALANVVPAKYRRLAFALADPDVADWLLAQLDLYEKARRPKRGAR